MGGTSVDTILYLFDENAIGVTANDDADDDNFQSLINSDDVNSTGIHHLAVTSYYNAPQAGGQDIWDTEFLAEGVPDGPGAGNPVDSWVLSDGTGEAGNYSIFLTGARFADVAVPEPATWMLLGGGGLITLLRRRKGMCQ